MDQEVLQKIGKYEILAELGRGGMGVVYLARDPAAGRNVALKTIAAELAANSESLQCYFREAQSAGSLEHRNIATVYDAGDADGRAYIAAELVQGESLQSIINLRAHLPLAAKLKLVQQVCEGLACAHQHGIVHRDVKPANILITNHGVVKLVDFGVAQLESSLLTKTGRFLGSIYYAAPEQINDGKVDHRADLWAVAAVTYEFIAYRRAFEGSNLAATIARILTSDPEPLSVCCPGVTAELDPIIARGLAKVPAERYSTFEDFLRDLEPVAQRLQQSLISELMFEAKALRSQGELSAARQKARATLILDQTHAEANRLLAEIQSEIEHGLPPDSNPRGPQSPPPVEIAGQEIALKQGLRHADKLVEEGKYSEARAELQELQKEFHNSTQIRLKLGILEPFVKAAMFVEDGRRAMSQGEYGEAVRSLSAALEFNPQDPQAMELKAAAIKERDRLRQVREALSAGQKAMRQGDSQTAEIELQKVLALDPSHGEGSSLLGQIRSARAPERHTVNMHEGLLRVESLLAEKKFEDAQYALLEMQRDYPDSAVIGQKLQDLQPRLKLYSLLAEGGEAFEQREFGEAVRILTEAQQLAPADEHIRELRVRAVQERDRLRQVREAISGGQRAFRQGEYEIAEKQFGRALQLDSTSVQAEDLLAQVRAERRAHAREGDLKAGLKEAEELIAAKKLAEARSRLEALKKDFPDAKQLEPLFETLKQRQAESALKPPLPMAEKRPAAQPTASTEYTRSMELAEELRLSLQKLKTAGNPRANPRTPPDSSSSPKPAPPPPDPPLNSSQEGNVTLVRGAIPAKPSAPPSPPDHNATIASTPKLTSSGIEKKSSATDPQKPEPKPDQT